MLIRHDRWIARYDSQIDEDNVGPVAKSPPRSSVTRPTTVIGGKSQQELLLQWVQRQVDGLVKEAAGECASIDDWTVRSFLRLPRLSELH